MVLVSRLKVEYRRNIYLEEYYAHETRHSILMVMQSFSKVAMYSST